MIKIFYILFLFFFSFLNVFGNEELKIITRSEWGADENYRFTDSDEWQTIFKKWGEDAKNNTKKLTENQIAKQKARALKVKEMNNILVTEYGKYIEVDNVKKYENGRKLAWPITKTKRVGGLVIHHTAIDYDDSGEGIKKIYKYHAINRQWGDIGYNYLIGNKGEIYEGRAGGDYVVGAQDKWNNMGTIGIALIGNYTDKGINDEQYDSLKKLSLFLLKKYNIDLTEKTYFHEECYGDKCKKPLFTKLKYPIIGHRDAGHTSCPGDILYKQIDNLRREILKEPIFAKKIFQKRIFPKLDIIGDTKLLKILFSIEKKLDLKKTDKYIKIKDLLLSYFLNKKSKNNFNINELNDNIKIKLSYPNNNGITIKSGKLIFEIKNKGNKLFIKGTSFNFLKIPKKNKNDILEILSWDRKPSWDTTGKLNDNKFRGDLLVYVKNNQLFVINSLKLNDYLKGLGEISDFENEEKIKTIIVAARSYALWYINKARKFPGELYDGSDNPNEFQRYLGYGLEIRSPNINKIVEETKGKVITYKGELIKPWYFSSSNGKTLSFYDYCIKKNSINNCTYQSKKYPYFQSTIDQGGIGNKLKGHGVGIPGTGVSYFAKKGWNYEMIIKYFLKGVEVL